MSSRAGPSRVRPTASARKARAVNRVPREDHSQTEADPEAVAQEDVPQQEVPQVLVDDADLTAPEAGGPSDLSILTGFRTHVARRIWLRIVSKDVRLFFCSLLNFSFVILIYFRHSYVCFSF